MKKLLTTILIFSALGASGLVFSKTPVEAYVATSPDKTVVVTIYNTPCLPPVADLLNPELVSKVKAGKVETQGKTQEACWGQVGEEVVVILENGSYGKLPAKEFKPLDGA